MTINVPPYLREASDRLEKQVGAEVAGRFKLLMYRVILNVCPTNKEFFAAQRRLLTSHDKETYEQVGEFRQVQYLNPAVLRLWRAVYSITVAEWFRYPKQAAEYYHVSVDDLKDLLKYWRSLGSPDLTNCLTYKDERQVWDRVTPDKFEISAETDRKISLRAKRLINEPQYQYLTKYEYFTADHLIADVRAYGLIRFVVQDWLPEIDRFQESYAFMRSHLTKIATHATAKERTRCLKVVDPVTGVIKYKNLVTRIEALRTDVEGMHPLEMLNPEGNGHLEVENEASGDELQDILINSSEFNPSERRILSAMFGKETDKEIDLLMEGEEVHDWMPWLCRQLGVDFKELTAKVVKLTGIKAKVKVPGKQRSHA